MVDGLMDGWIKYYTRVIIVHNIMMIDLVNGVFES